MKGIIFSPMSIMSFPNKIVTRRLVKRRKKPLYNIGDVCYVKERWRVPEELEKYSPSGMPGDVLIDYRIGSDTEESSGLVSWGRWRNALFLPARFARFFIKIEDVRMESLLDITHEDAVREGCDSTKEYLDLWDAIHGDGEFCSRNNPNVWRIHFSHKKGDEIK